MSGNAQPIWTRVGDVSVDGSTGMATHILTATGDYSGVSANYILVFTSDSTNGGYVERLHFVAEGTNIASVARIFINNGSTHTTATNNTFYGQLSLPATTAINNAATAELDYGMGIAINPSFSIYVGLGTTVAAGWVVTAVAGKY